MLAIPHQLNLPFEGRIKEGCNYDQVGWFWVAKSESQIITMVRFPRRGKIF